LIFYINLPEYTKKTQRLSNQAILLREAIANSKEPEKTFFEDIPKALGFNIDKLKDSDDLLGNFVVQLQKCIKEIRESYTELIDRVEEYIKKLLEIENSDFPEYKYILSKRLKAINNHLLTQQQKIVLSRVNSEFNERVGWTNSFVSAILGKSLDNINDDDEKLLFEKIYDTINEFDNIIDIIKFDNDGNNTDVVKFQLTTLDKGTRNITIVVPKNGEIKEIENKIKKHLTSDVKKNQKILLKLLNEQLENE